MEKLQYSDILISETRKEMVDKLERFTRAHPTDMLAYLKLGDLERENGSSKVAARLHKTLLANPSTSPEIRKRIYRSIIRDYISIPDYESAISFCKELEKIARDDVPSLQLIDEVYEDNQLWDEVLQIKQRILKLKDATDNTTLGILHSFIGKEFLKQGKKNEGLKHLKQSLKLDELCVTGMLFLAEYYYGKNRDKEAISLFMKILKEMPGYSTPVFERLEKLLYEKGRFSEMVTIYENFLNDHPDHSPTLLSLALLYKKRGDDAQAVEFLKRVLEFDTKNTEAMKELLQLYLDKKDVKQVSQLVNQLLNTIKPTKKFRCENCGHRFKDFLFRCPNCKKWMTIK